MPKKPKKFNKEAECRGALRRVFVRSPVIREVMLQARRETPRTNKDGSTAKRPAVEYRCNLCHSWRPGTDVAVDHKEPVVSVSDGFQGWEVFMARLFCDASNLQVVCSACHDSKTAVERKARSEKKKRTQAKAESSDDDIYTERSASTSY